MKKNITKILIIFIVITSITIFTNSCYDDEGDAIVTIHLERNDLSAMGIKLDKPLGIIDRILTFFSTRAEAASWNDDKTNLTLRVTSIGFDEKTFIIPTGSTSFTTTLPSGYETTFTITAGANVIQRRWGGQIVLNLIPGDQDISIKMLPMTWIYSADGSGHLVLYWVDTSFPISISSFNVYKSSSSTGLYQKVASNVASFNDTAAVIGTTYYYRISTNSIYGESVLCAPYAASRMY